MITQVVLLVAGKGSRMRHLTAHTPKPLVEVAGRPMLDYIVETLPPSIKELIFVTNYLEKDIKEHAIATYGNDFLVSFPHQTNPKGGTGDALMCAQPYVSGKFLMLYGDDIMGAHALAAVCEEQHGMLVTSVVNPEAYGTVEVNDRGALERIVEKSPHPKTRRINIGGWVLEPDIFTYAYEPESGKEMYATEMMNQYAKTRFVAVVEQSVWIPVGNPDERDQAEDCLSKDKYMLAA